MLIKHFKEDEAWEKKTMNHTDTDTDEHIYKLFLLGLSLAQIARKIGRPDDRTRVLKGLARKGVRFALMEVHT